MCIMSGLGMRGKKHKIATKIRKKSVSANVSAKREVFLTNNDAQMARDVQSGHYGFDEGFDVDFAG